MTSDPRIIDAARHLTDLGFALESKRKHAGPSRLLIALRDRPTVRHFDPALALFWESNAEGRGHRAELDRSSAMPVRTGFSWGSIELVDRFGVRNDFVTLGGELLADRTDSGTTTIVLSSPGPIRSLGGHSQRADGAGLEIGAFFGRMMVPIDFQPGMEQAISDASPLARYAAFLGYEEDRFERHAALRAGQPDYARLTLAEVRRLASSEPREWEAGQRLLAQMRLAA